MAGKHSLAPLCKRKTEDYASGLRHLKPGKRAKSEIARMHLGLILHRQCGDVRVRHQIAAYAHGLQVAPKKILNGYSRG